MNKSLLTNTEISNAVKNALMHKEWSVRQCCDAFNHAHAQQIKASKMESLNKDFVQRIQSNKFSVVTDRVSNLCTFLGVDLEQRPPQFFRLQNAFKQFESLVSSDPAISEDLDVLLTTMANIVAKRGAQVK